MDARNCLKKMTSKGWKYLKDTFKATKDAPHITMANIRAEYGAAGLERNLCCLAVILFVPG